MVKEMIPPPERRRVSMINFGNKKPEKEEDNRHLSGIKFETNENHEDEMDNRLHDKMTAMDRHDELKRQMNGQVAPPSKPAFDSNAKAPTKPFQSVRPQGVFHTEADTKADGITKILIEKYPQYASDQLRIKNLIKQLVTNDLMTVSTWAEPFLVEQRNLVDLASTRIREFNALNGSQLLSEVLDFNRQEHADGGFFKRFTSKFSNSEAYTLKVTALKQGLSGILPILLKYNTDCKSSMLSLYTAVLSVVDDNTTGRDKLIEEAFYNRRLLLNGAMKNLEMLAAQLNQTLELITNMTNEISHLMDVVLPALKMKNARS